ncbi:MAG: pyridoxal phosphate-dependent aminotransferase [Methylococcales bacterium]|nr:pyridoxal phosphate-dependent aminotransferase [Methylococcales bacterium]MDD5753364.1 pyridoxal phosphate-dependent aminotransferase [Methylococcales bacterium]
MKIQKNNLLLSERIKEFEKRIKYITPKCDMTFGYPVDLHERWMEDFITNIDGNLLQNFNSDIFKKDVIDYFSKVFGENNNTFITTSASEALLVAIHSCIQHEDDEVILFDYGFYNYPELISSAKGKPVFAKRDAKNRRPIIESVANCVTGKTRAVIITQPENPLGQIFSKDELQQLCLLCIEKNVILIVDHAFIESAYFGFKINKLFDLNFEVFLKNLSWIVVGDTGKIVCLHGIKYGCLLVSDNLRVRIESWLQLILFQFDSVHLYVLSKILNDSRLELYKTGLYDKMANNLELLKSKLDDRIVIFQPVATPMVLLDISKFGMDDVFFVEKLLEKEKVALMPGCYFIFGEEENHHYSKSHVRMAISRPRQVVEDAILKINHFVSEL